MPDIIPTKLILLEPVLDEGQTYLTSQYFHRQYIEQSTYGGRYSRFDNFMRLLRSIPTYADHIGLGNILELIWSALKEEQPQKVGYFKPLFEATGYQPLILLNATAQAALTHHLDDQLSRQMSVAINTHATRGRTSPLVLAQQDMQTWKELAEMFQAPLHIAPQEGVKYVEKTHGVDLRPLLLASPSQDNIAEAELMLEPTELAQQLGYPSAMAMNKGLEQLGWQYKRAGIWEPTIEGAQHSSRHAWINKGKSGYNTKWNLVAVRQALQQVSEATT